MTLFTRYRRMPEYLAQAVTGLAALIWCTTVLPAKPSRGVAAGELLTLDQALDTALQQNRQVENAGINVAKATDKVDAARTRQLPRMHLEVKESYNLTPQSFTFDAGTFGSVPEQDVEIDAKEDFTTITSLSVKQPLSELYRIGLSIDQHEVNQQIAGQRLRAQRQSVIKDVKKAYYDLLKTRSVLHSTGDSIAYYEELEREVEQNYRQQTVLEYQLLEVQSRLAHARHRASSEGNRLISEQERLNKLLGRDVNQRFRVSDVGVAHAVLPDRGQAEKLALEQRPEMNEASLKLLHAQYGYRIKRAEYLPDVDLRLDYTRLYNTRFIPDELSSVGLTARWEFYDWGRKSHDLSIKQSDIRQARNQLREAEDQILIEVGKSIRKLEDAIDLVAVTKLSERAMQEKARVLLNQYKQQSALLDDVLKAESGWSDAVTEHQQALLSVRDAQAKLAKAMGEE